MTAVPSPDAEVFCQLNLCLPSMKSTDARYYFEPRSLPIRMHMANFELPGKNNKTSKSKPAMLSSSLIDHQYIDF